MKITKIIILCVVSVLLIAGVLVFAKTRVSPPTFVKLGDPFPEALEKSCKSFDSLSDFQSCSKAYIALDDKIARFRTEEVIENKTADDARLKMDEHYGEVMTDYGMKLFSSSAWDDATINQIISSMQQLASNRLSDGRPTVGKEFKSKQNQINGIYSKYKEALAFSKNTGYTSVADASAKISKANSYMKEPYLRNNAALMSALNSMPKRLADGHYAHVKSVVNSLGGYRSTSRENYVNNLVARADAAIKEYQNTGVYGSAKQSAAGLEQQAKNLINNALDYYDSVSTSDYYNDEDDDW